MLRHISLLMAPGSAVRHHRADAEPGKAEELVHHVGAALVRIKRLPGRGGGEGAAGRGQAQAGGCWLRAWPLPRVFDRNPRRAPDYPHFRRPGQAPGGGRERWVASSPGFDRCHETGRSGQVQVSRMRCSSLTRGRSVADRCQDQLTRIALPPPGARVSPFGAWEVAGYRQNGTFSHQMAGSAGRGLRVRSPRWPRRTIQVPQARLWRPRGAASRASAAGPSSPRCPTLPVPREYARRA